MPAPEQLEKQQKATDALEAALLEHNLRVTPSSAKQAHQSRPDTPKDRTSSGRKATPLTPSKHSSEAEVPLASSSKKTGTPCKKRTAVKAEVDTPPDRKHQVAKKAKKSVSKDEKDLRLSQGMYDMIEACLATKKIWMLSQDIQLPPSWTDQDKDRKSNTIKKLVKHVPPLMVKKAGLGRNQYQLTDEAKELLESSSLEKASSEEDSSNQHSSDANAEDEDEDA
jgi:hypothetical protein